MGWTRTRRKREKNSLIVGIRMTRVTRKRFIVKVMFRIMIIIGFLVIATNRNRSIESHITNSLLGSFVIVSYKLWLKIVRLIPSITKVTKASNLVNIRNLYKVIRMATK